MLLLSFKQDGAPKARRTTKGGTFIHAEAPKTDDTSCTDTRILLLFLTVFTPEEKHEKSCMLAPHYEGVKNSQTRKQHGNSARIIIPLKHRKGPFRRGETGLHDRF